jgi:hypothetical protein
MWPFKKKSIDVAPPLSNIASYTFSGYRTVLPCVPSIAVTSGVMENAEICTPHLSIDAHIVVDGKCRGYGPVKIKPGQLLALHIPLRSCKPSKK